MKTDVTIIYEHIRHEYPVSLSSSLDRGFKSVMDFPVLHGHSVLGDFELFYDGVSFPFYAMREDGTLYAHWHLQTVEEAEKTIVDFMQGNIARVQLGQPSNT